MIDIQPARGSDPSTFAKQVPASIAPFVMSASLSSVGVVPSLWIVAAAGIVGLDAFVAIPIALRMSRDRESGSYGPMTEPRPFTK